MAVRPLNSVAGFSIGEYPSTTVVDGNANVTANNFTATTTANLGAVGNVTITGGTSGYYLQTDGSGGLSWAAVPSGNGIANGTSNITIPTSGGNVVVYVGGTNSANITSTGANITGTLNATGNANVGNIGATAGVFTANVTAGNVYANSGTIGALTLKGEGGNISNIQGANVSGAVASATAATNASALLQNTSTATTVYPTFTTSGANGNSSAVINTNISANLGNASITATTFVGALSGAATTAGTVTTAAQPNITVVGVLSNLVVANTIYADGYGARTGSDLTISTAGNGNLLFSIAGTGRIDGGNANIANVKSIALTSTGTAINASSGNILTNEVTGTKFNFLNGSYTATLTGSGATSTYSLNLPANAGTNGQLLSSDGTGNLLWTSPPSTSTIVNGTSNVNIATSGGNVTTSVAGNANILVVTGTGANITGTANVSGNANVGNLGTAQVLASANVTAPQLISNVATGTAPLVVTSTTRVSNLNVANAGYADSAGSATTAGTVTTAAQPNITSVGTLSALSVTGNTTSGNFIGALANGNSNVNIPAAAGNINLSVNGTANVLVVTDTGANISGTLNATGNANVGNIGATTAVFTTGNITTVNSGLVQNGTSNVTIASGGNVSAFIGGNATAQFVVTSTGANIAGTANVVGNANVGNLGTGGIITATGNITSSANLISDNILGRTGALTITSAGTNTNINLKPNGTGNIDANSTYITNLKDPSNPQDAATKNYVDTVAQGLHIHTPVLVATTDTLANATGGTVTYNNGTSGVNANLVTTGSYTTIDGNSVASVGTRILVKNEANAVWNGIYTYANSTTIVRATDADTPAELGGGDFVFVETGSVNADTGWVMTSDPPITIGTTNIVWAQFSGAGTYTAGTGLTLTGTVFSITNTAVTAASYGNGDRVASFTVNSQGQLTAASNVVIAANAANLTGTTLNSSIVTSSLTSVGTLGSLTVTGNVTAGNANVTGQLISTVATGTAPLVVSSTTQVANLNAATAGTAGTVTTAAQPNITSVGTLSSLTVSGNVSTGNISGTNGNLTTANVSGNVILGNASVTTAISWASATTSAITANQTIASFSVTGVVGVEFIVKGIDSTGSKYSMSTINAVTDGANVDYATFGGVTLGGYTGSFNVAVVGGQLRLQVTPSSSNSTVWTTQYRFV